MKRSEILCNESSHATFKSCSNTFVITNGKYGIVLYNSFWIQRCWQLYSIAVQILTRDFLLFHDCQFIEFVSDFVGDHLAHTFWTSAILLVTIGIEWSAKGIRRIWRWFFQVCGRLIEYLFLQEMRIAFKQDISLLFQAVFAEIFLFFTLLRLIKWSFLPNVGTNK